MGEQSRSARRNEKRHGSGNGRWKEQANRFKSGRLTHLIEQEVVTDAFSNNEADAQEIERVKIGSNKICNRGDLAKEKMVFSEELSRAIFAMWS